MHLAVQGCFFCNFNQLKRLGGKLNQVEVVPLVHPVSPTVHMARPVVDFSPPIHVLVPDARLAWSDRDDLEERLDLNHSLIKQIVSSIHIYGSGWTCWGPVAAGWLDLEQLQLRGA